MRERQSQNPSGIKDYFFVGVFMLGVIALRLFYITRTSGPFIYADEFGYWSHAAHMAGQTWAGVMDGVSWYSFGYSFWLALTFLFSDQMEVMFHVAILINIVMSLGTYLLAYRIVCRLAGGLDRITCGFIAFATTSFPTYIFYAYTTMAETLAALVVWLLFYEMISLEERPAWWKGVLAGVTAGYAYMVHNRLLTAVLAVGVCLAALWIAHRIDWKVIASFAVSLAAMFAAYVLIKGYLESLIVANQALADTGTAITRGGYNTLSYMIRKFFRVLHPERLFSVFLGVLGQLWQLLSSTYLLAGLGAVCCVLHWKKKPALNGCLCAYGYPILTLFFSIGMTAVAAQGSLKEVGGRVRIDPLFYGRYSECFFPMIIAIALIMLCTEEVRSVLKIFLGTAVVYLCLTAVMLFRMRGIENGFLNIVSSVSIHVFHWLGEFSVWKCCLAALLGGGVVVLLCRFRRLGKWGCYGGFLALLFLFSTTALCCMRMSIRGENDYTLQYTPIYEYLNQNTVEGDLVYTCMENKQAFDLQTRLVDKAVVCVLTEQVGEMDDGAYVVVRDDQMEELAGADYDVCLECNGQIVIRLRK